MAAPAGIDTAVVAISGRESVEQHQRDRLG
jgi:hypothetical protein